jgi:cardiolipin synthase
MDRRKKMLLAGLVGAVIAVLLTVLALNFVAGEKRIQHRLKHHYAIDNPQFLRELGTLLGPPIIDGNQVRNLENGTEIFPAMLDAIRGARHNINFETYIYWSGEVGREFADALSERARSGVEVNVLLDWVGSKSLDQSLIDEMKSAGAEVELYHPLRWYSLARMNNRTHRKLLVVDGEIGFTGGVGIADKWAGNADSPDHWRDSHYELRGPAVAQMQAAFLDNWIKATGSVLQGERYFPPLTPSGDARGQVFTASPTGGGESMQLMYLMSITAATRTIDLSASYFVPDSLTRQALRAALQRGVRVRIIVPGNRIDAELVRKASRAQWGELLQAGAQIHEYQPTMFHCKTLIVDGLMVSVGSTNFDNRSFRLNDEANLNIYDAPFAATATEVFENDLKRAKQISYEAWLRRPYHEKIIEHVSSLFSSQL